MGLGWETRLQQQQHYISLPAEAWRANKRLCALFEILSFARCKNTKGSKNAKMDQATLTTPHWG